MFLQEETRQQHGDGGVKRADEHGGIEAPGLAGEDEHGAAADIEHTSREAPDNAGAIHRAELSGHQHDGSGGEKGNEARDPGEPEYRTVARFLDAEKVAGESDPGKKCGADAVRLAGWTFGARDQPDSDAGQQETDDGYGAGRAFRKNAEGGGDGGAEYGGNGRGESHVALRKRAVKNGKGDSAEQASGDRPGDGMPFGKAGMKQQGEQDHQASAADMRNGGEKERVRST